MENNPCNDLPQPELGPGEFRPDRYEVINLIVKSRPDGKSWFDVVFDMITEECQGDGDEKDCTCGMESMGGSGGTLEQCYSYSTTVGSGLQPIDLARAIADLVDGFEPDSPTKKVIEWARKEIEFEESFENLQDDEDEEEYELPEEFEPYFSNEELPEGVLEILKGEEPQYLPGGDEGDCRGLIN